MKNQKLKQDMIKTFKTIKISLTWNAYCQVNTSSSAWTTSHIRYFPVQDIVGQYFRERYDNSHYDTETPSVVVLHCKVNLRQLWKIGTRHILIQWVKWDPYHSTHTQTHTHTQRKTKIDIKTKIKRSQQMKKCTG